MEKKNLLITGASGYIGSHAIAAFEGAGYQTISIDNFSNSSPLVLEGVSNILSYTPIFHEGDIRDRDFLRGIFEKYQIDGVIHFAGLKAVGESVEKPHLYYDNNIHGSMILFEVMQEYQVKNIVFSSSATVYRSDAPPPYEETMPLGATNPYGTTKIIIEQLLEDLARCQGWSAIALRYFNPIGAHPSGYIGELPNGTPNNLLPYILEVALGRFPIVTLYGDDYPTIDGTGVRDYIDVNDLVDSHVSAYKKLSTGYLPINIGTGKGVSVKEMIHECEVVIGKSIPYRVSSRRPGDIASCFASVERSRQLLGWSPVHTLRESIETAWRFRSRQ